MCVDDRAESSTLSTANSQKDASRELKALAFAAVGLLASLLVFVLGLQFVSRSGRTDSENPRVAQAADLPRNAAIPAPSDAIDRAAAPTRNIVATITAASGAQWGPTSAGAGVLSRWAVGDRLKLLSGSAELTFDAGAQVRVYAPAEFVITSPTSIRCLRGRVTTLVDQRGRGFSIETPSAKVVDLGTQFGLSISDKGETEVVVFQGSVDLFSNKQRPSGDSATRRMEQGEALLLKKSGEFERVVAVQRNSFMEASSGLGRRLAEPVIADVRDNIRDPQSPVKSYQIVRGGLADDALAFVDRYHQWNGLDSSGLPAFLSSADYIMPFNDDKFVHDLELKVRLLRAASLYVFIDNNMAVPGWLQRDFADTGVDIGLDCSKTEWHKDHSLGTGPGRSIDFTFSVWKRNVKEAGTVVLGGLSPPEIRSHGFNMYGVAAVAAD
jgi:hypothetical protein